MTTQDLLKTNWKYLEAMRDGQVVEYNSDSTGVWRAVLDFIQLSNLIITGVTFRIKPKPIECWAVVFSNGGYGIYQTLAEAEHYKDEAIAHEIECRLVHLVEQPEEGEVGSESNI